MPETYPRRLPVGAEAQPGGVHFRVWAPQAQRVEVTFEGGPGARSAALALGAEKGGYHAGFAPKAGPGTRYRFRLDGGDALPDLASRFQPEGPLGPSEVVDPDAFVWAHPDWKGATMKEQVAYEMHIGTFTPEGTWEAAIRKLPLLAETGITLLEVMPVADFTGNFGWGYDGVNFFAPTRLYGRPDDFRRFIDAAHGLGMAVILDVVFNHVGPSGSFFKHYAERYFSSKHANEWGEGINFDGADAGPVREFFISNAAYWIREYRLDGLRIDATQAIVDDSAEHVIAAIATAARKAAGDRSIVLVGENEPQHMRLVRPVEEGGYGLDALWNDDFHHSAVVALTGHNPAYYVDYHGKPQEFISALKWGYLFQGQYYRYSGKRRGTSALGSSPRAFVNFFENHDQIANSVSGKRMHQLTSPGRYRAFAALLILAPGTPMLFQGQEFGSSRPFHYFADHEEEMAELVRKGRLEFLTQFPTIAQDAVKACIAHPDRPETFRECRLDWSEYERHAEMVALHKDLIALRKSDPAFRMQRVGGVDGAVLGDEAFLIRFFLDYADDRLLLVNLGSDLELSSAPEPLLAPPSGKAWKMLWTSEHPRYGGTGTVYPESEKGWLITGHSAIVLHPVAE